MIGAIIGILHIVFVSLGDAYLLFFAIEYTIYVPSSSKKEGSPSNRKTASNIPIFILKLTRVYSKKT